MTKKKKIIAAGVGVLVLLVLIGGGGPPDELEVKGLRLGMSVEDAARVMLGHGFEIGGKADPGYNEWAFREHAEAALKHNVAYIRKVCADRGFTDFGAYARFAAEESGLPVKAAEDRLWRMFSKEEHDLFAEEIARRMARFVRAESERLGASTLDEYINIHMAAAPEAYRPHPNYIRSNFGYSLTREGELERGVLKWFNEGPDEHLYVPLLPDGERFPNILDVVAEQAPEGTLSLANLEVLLENLAINHPENIEAFGRLIPESAVFPDLEAYIAEHYPEGRPYHLGGPWDGNAKLELESVRRGMEWTLGVDEQRQLVRIELGFSAVNKLFGADDMSAEEFAATFASAYDVPLESTADVVNPDIAIHTGNFLRIGWAYVNREGGWAVTIDQHKNLKIEAITPAEQQSFD